MKVLIVEDNFFDKCSLERLIKRNPNLSDNVDCAGSVSEAKEKVIGSDLILLDLKLPDVPGGKLDEDGGLHILEYLKSQISTRKKPVLIVVSQYYQDDPQTQNIFTAGLDSFISKWIQKMGDKEELSRFLSELTFQK